MGKTLDTISTINSAVRTGLALFVCSVLGMGGYYAYNAYHAQEIAAELAQAQLQATQAEIVQAKQMILERDAEITKQSAEIKSQQQKISKLETSLRLLKVDHRVARMSVIDQSTDADGQTIHKLEFEELNDEGHPLGPARKFELRGELVYVDGLVVKFEDKYIEQADIDRASSLFVFKRIFTDSQKINCSTGG